MDIKRTESVHKRISGRRQRAIAFKTLSNMLRIGGRRSPRS
jgi:hypothetical protein